MQLEWAATRCTATDAAAAAGRGRRAQLAVQVAVAVAIVSSRGSWSRTLSTHTLAIFSDQSFPWKTSWFLARLVILSCKLFSKCHARIFYTWWTCSGSCQRNAQRATCNLQPVTNRPAVSAAANSNANKTTTAATATTTFDLNFKLNAF